MSLENPYRDTTKSRPNFSLYAGTILLIGIPVGWSANRFAISCANSWAEGRRAMHLAGPLPWT